MIEKLEHNVELWAERAENLSFCRGIKLLNIKDTVAQMIEQIGKFRIFEQYTLHDVSHINEMLKIAEWLIPKSTQAQMTAAEWLMLTLAIYLHDLGMVVSRSEYEQREQNVQYTEYRRCALEENPAEYIKYISNEEYLYQEYVRENHAIRIRDWLSGNKTENFKSACEVTEILDNALSGLDEKFKIDLAMICESHHRDDIGEFNKYKIKSRYGNLDDEIVNLNYIAIILRCADLLHITSDRTPAIAKKLLNISNPTSILEWEKQHAVRAITPKSERNSDGAIDETITKDTVEITAYFSGPDTAEAFFGLSSYLQYMEKELAECSRIAEKAKKIENSKYDFPWKKVDTSNITTVGFETKKLSFTIEQDNILNLLVGHTLYNDSSVVVRELTQNAIDAIRFQRLIYQKDGRTSYEGSILIEWDSNSRTLTFSDNGTGMTISDIENYLLKVGASKYRDKEIKKIYSDFSPISRFGIGILTCFMVANDIDIITNPNNNDDVNVICLRNICGTYLLKKQPKDNVNSYIKKHGTIIKLHIKQDVDMESLEHDLRKWIVNPGVCVQLKIDDSDTIRIDKESLSAVLKEYLSEEGIEVDGITYKVEEKTIGGVTVACALLYSQYWSDWNFVSFHDSRTETAHIPLGTCVEGIRVEFTTPGFKTRNLLAIANVVGSKHQTNVARTALEYDSNNETLKAIYECYRMFIEDQVNCLIRSKYSESWAVNECQYIMQSIINYNLERTDPIDKELLWYCMADLKLLFLESENKRELLSVNDVRQLNQFDIVDCKTIKAVETLLTEIPSTTTVQEILHTVCHDNQIIDHSIPTIVNYNELNILHRYALSGKQVSRIYIDKESRTIRLTISKDNNHWNSQRLLSGYSSFFGKNLYIPKENFQIEGLTNEVGVSTIGGIYLNSDTELCDYLKSVIQTLSTSSTSDGKKENSKLLSLFLSFVFNSSLLERSISPDESKKTIRHYFDLHDFNTYELPTKIWNIIDITKFSEIVLAKKHILFSLDNWERRNNGYGEVSEDLS